MADDKRFNVLYKPELRPERNYRSEAEFTVPPTPAVEISTPPEETPRDVVEQLKELEELAHGLPEGLEFVAEVVNILERRAEVIATEIELEENIPEPETVGPQPGTIMTPKDVSPNIRIGTNVKTYIPTDPTLPKIFPPPSNVVINVETPKTLVQISQDNYKKDQIDLQKYYLQNMRLVLQRYFQHQLTLMAELGISNIDMLTKKYDGEMVSGVSANNKHLHDTIIRSQLQRDQKARYYKKIANADQTLMHMRQWNAAEKLRERYYDEAYGDSEKFVDSEANAILRQNRSEYDAGYKASLYNMYKYLDSSISMTGDILDDTLIESKAKAKLLKDGVDIFAAKQYSMGDAVQTTQAQTSEQAKAAKEFENAKNDTSQQKPSAEDIDKANKVEDPADEKIWGLAPNGGHWSKNDIQYLMDLDPVAYNNTAQGIENIKIQLATAPKYAANDNNEEGSNDNSNKSTENKTETVANNSQEKVEKVVGGESTPTSSDSSTSTSDSSASREIISKEETQTVGNYTITYKYKAYPYTSANIGGVSKGYDEYFTGRVVQGDKSVYIVTVSKYKELASKKKSALKSHTSAEEQSIINTIFDKFENMHASYLPKS